jgi:hypothetical protein
LPRFCMRGCGRKVGWNQKFCSAECRNEDKAERMRSERQRSHKNGRCSHCGVPLKFVEVAKALEREARERRKK